MDIRTIKTAAILFSVESEGKCPTLEALMNKGYLDRGKRITDPWDTPFIIECTVREIRILSPGPDRKVGTEDDIREVWQTR
jgi:general secretion pathway protein G